MTEEQTVIEITDALIIGFLERTFLHARFADIPVVEEVKANTAGKPVMEIVKHDPSLKTLSRLVRVMNEAEYRVHKDNSITSFEDVKNIFLKIATLIGEPFLK